MKTLLLSVLIIAGFAFTAAAQETEISKEEFRRILGQGLGSVNGSRLPHRFTVLQESVSEGPPVSIIISSNLTENTADGLRRTVMESNFDGKKQWTEMITKGSVTVIRRCADCQWQVWRESPSPAPASPLPTRSSARASSTGSRNLVVSNSSVYHHLGTEIYKDKRVNVYRETKRAEKSLPNGKRETRETTFRVLIPIDGGFYRMETVSKTTAGGTVKYTKFTFEKVLDPSITVTMPEVN